MKKKSQQLKLFVYIFLLIELAALAVFTIFYFLDSFNFQEIINGYYLIGGVIAVVAINIILVAIVVLNTTNLRYQTDLRAAEVIGEDVQEAYNFAMIGLLITDDNYSIIWSNELFFDRHIDVIDKNIFDWQPQLASLVDKNDGVSSQNIQIATRNYNVKFLSQAGLWIFKDTTDYETVCLHNKNQAPVVGILSIDNYDDVVKGEEDYNDSVIQVKNHIFNYAKKYDILLRRIKESDYMMFCNFASYEKMKEDNFSILDEVRQVTAKEAIPLTLSIGLAREFPDFIKLYDLAASSLSTALSRGGDQVVVSVYDSDMEFYGGKTKAQANQNRVLIRGFVDALLNQIKSSSNVLIMGHRDMDMDALGSCLGVRAMCDRLKIESKLVVDLKLTESKTRAAITTSFSKGELDKLIASPKEAISLITPSTLIVVVDVNVPGLVMAPALLEKIERQRVVVIDHHRKGEISIEDTVLSTIDPSASSACEIIAELIKYSSITPRIELPSIFATIMLAGIFLDSEYYKSDSTGIRTFESSTILKEYGANISMADNFLKDDFEEYHEIHSIVSQAKTVEYGVLFACADQQTRYDTATIAKIANACMQIKGVNASFVIGKLSDKEIKLCARSDGSINVQLLCEKMGGGGHFNKAASVFLKSDLKEVEKIVTDTISAYIQQAKTPDFNRNEGGNN